jgi:sRNA-binding carbon storage regulator CsrA
LVSETTVRIEGVAILRRKVLLGVAAPAEVAVDREEVALAKAKQRKP